MTKVIVCACEDVTLEEVRAAYRGGSRDLESVKRVTGFGTGPCQGKSCVARVVRELLALGATEEEVRPFTARPPVELVGLGELAGVDGGRWESDEGVPRGEGAEHEHEPGPTSTPTSTAGPPHPDPLPPLRGGRGRNSDAPAHGIPLAPSVAPQQAARSRGATPTPTPTPTSTSTGGPPHPGPLPPLRGESGRNADPLPSRSDVVIVGGGIMGLALACELGRRGVTDVLVLERGYLNAGASGRNGGGVRAQWSTPTMIRLARRSLAICARFAVDLGVNVWFRRGGYLFLAPTREQVARIERNAALHRREGLRTRVVSPDEAAELAPELDRRRFLAASWNPDDGVVFPWPFLWAYAAEAERRGARVRTFTRVTGFDLAGPRIAAVRTDRGRVACDVVVNAAGAWSKAVAALAGVALPNRPVRHEILVTEPLKPWLDPLVSVLGTGLYFSQSQRGELVGGMGDPAEPEGLGQGSTLRFLARFARAATELVPRLAGVKVVRQWAGLYDVTPDNNPILGPAGPENFLQLSGFVGHGFMMAPAVAELYADLLAGRGRDEIFDRFTTRRFEGGPLAKEDFIIG